MTTPTGLRVISVTKTLEGYKLGDPNIARYFGATMLAGRVGLFLSALRKHRRMKWEKFAILANTCHIEDWTLQRDVVPWLERSGFIEVGGHDPRLVECNVFDFDAIFRSVEGFLSELNPKGEERIVLSLLDFGIRMPTSESEVMTQLSGEPEELVRRALSLAGAYSILKSVRPSKSGEVVVYSPLIWGDNISKAGSALVHLDSTRRQLLVSLIDMVREYQGVPEARAVNWATQNGDGDLVEFAIGIGLLDRTEIRTTQGGQLSFLTTPHLYGQLAATQGKDVCDRVRLFLDSIRHGQHFGKWHTGRVTDPVALLNRLLNQGEIGPCTAIGTDYVLVEKAGVVDVVPSKVKAGQYVMRLVQDDTIRLVRDVMSQQYSAEALLPATAQAAGQGPSIQHAFVSAEQTRAERGQSPRAVREAEVEMLRNLRELV